MVLQVKWRYIGTLPSEGLPKQPGLKGISGENGIYFAQPQGVFFHIRKSECWHNWTPNFKWEVSSSHKWNCHQRPCFHISNLGDHVKCWGNELERRKWRWVCLSKMFSQCLHFLTESVSIMTRTSKHQTRSTNKDRTDGAILLFLTELPIAFV